MPLLPEVSEKMSGGLWMASYAHSLLGRNEERRLAITEDYWVEKGVCSGLLSKESSKQVWCEAERKNQGKRSAFGERGRNQLSNIPGWGPSEDRRGCDARTVRWAGPGLRGLQCQ